MESTHMADHKRLDYNAPLLSIRRFAAPAPAAATSSDPEVTTSGAEDSGGAAAEVGWFNRCSLPFYKSELKSGPVRNPGVVPFVWEQSPGRPRDGGDASGSDVSSPQKPLQRPRSVVKDTKLPPTVPPRILVSGPASPAAAAAASSTFSASCTETSFAKSMDGSVEDNKVMEEGEVSEEDCGGSVEDDGDEDAFSDAQEALSSTESCFMNCSISGLSGGIGVRDPSCGFSTDLQVREFMMSRFLPAAQAMTTDSPQLSTRKRSVPNRDPAKRALADGGDRRPSRSPAPVPYTFQNRPRHPIYGIVGYNNVSTIGGRRDRRDRRRESDGDRFAKKGGWLPRLCLRGSMCLLNPIPAMKVRCGHIVNSSARSSESKMGNRRLEGGFLVKAFAESRLQSQESGLVPSHGDDLRFIPKPFVVKQASAPANERRPSKLQEPGKKETGEGMEDILPPALPKSPTESWLCQTLPSVQSKNPAPQSFRGVLPHSRRQQVMIRPPSSSDRRWETIPKDSVVPPLCGTRLAEVLSRPADED